MRLDILRWWALTQFTAQERLRLYRKIAKMLVNGMPLLKVLEELRQREAAGNHKSTEPLVIILDDCRRAVQNGLGLAEGLAPWIPRTEQMILVAGEQSGCLEGALHGVVDVVKAQRRIRSVVLGGIVYPAALTILVIVYMYLFGTRVIPEFARIVDPDTWSGVAKSLYVMSNVVRHWTLYIVAALGAAIAAVLFSMPRWRGSLRVFLDRFAPFSIYRLVTGSSFLLAFSALQTAGITVEKSLMRLSVIASPWLRQRIDGALIGVKSGLNCGEALRNAGYGFPSKEVIEDLCVYAEYKGFAESLKTVANEWMEEGVEQISLQMKVLNGMAIILLAIVIGWLVTGFFGIQHEIAALARRH